MKTEHLHPQKTQLAGSYNKLMRDMINSLIAVKQSAYTFLHYFVSLPERALCAGHPVLKQMQLQNFQIVPFLSDTLQGFSQQFLCSDWYF